jgi:AAA domain
MDMSEANGDSVEALILERLAGSGLPSAVADFVVAALHGDDDLAAALSPGRPAQSVTLRAVQGTGHQPVGTYVKAITVEGFRGIGPETTLRLQPGPGLTLVAGRNGSGKSSFAEAAELALTGDDKRWSMPGRGAVWRTGWHNLHTPEGSRLAVALASDGQAGVTTVERVWEPGARLEDSAGFEQVPGKPRQPFESLRWAGPLELYRPFLSYSELGALVTGRPSEMYDAVQAILGLDQLIEAEDRLTDARKRLDESSKLAARALPGLLDQLNNNADERARQAEAVLRQRPPDLAALEALAVGGRAGGDGLVRSLQKIAALDLPATEVVRAAVERLSGADRKVADLAGTPAADARRVASLLGTALTHYADHPGQPCPVCAGRVLDQAWEAGAREEMARLAKAARDADEAHAELDTAARAVRHLIPAEPTVLSTDLAGEVDTSAAHAAWQQWAGLADAGTVEQLAAEAGGRFTALATSVGQLRKEAARAAAQRIDAWRPVGAALASWADLARASQRDAASLGNVKKAIIWLREAGKEVRNARLAPFAGKSARVWEMLRQESNVDLGPIRLEGSATQRRVSLDVTVDGVPGAALGVMSQGELHALGLALFLPRATAPRSPFRFLIIDDPVQSMDPAKVDGLARLLSEVAVDRQVIVFTHDDRLPEALRRLQLPVTVWEVVRRERSVVELKKNDDPVTRYIDDARAIALTRDLPEQARAVVVAGFCRSALEAACHEVVRTQRLAAGARHVDVERALADAHTLHQVFALALFDDATRGHQVTPTLQHSYGERATRAFRAAKTGPHGAYRGDLASCVNDTARLAAALRSGPAVR